MEKLSKPSRIAARDFFQRDIVVVVEIVEANDGVTALEQLPGGVETDEAGGACDENFHAAVFLTSGRRPHPAVIRT